MKQKYWLYAGDIVIWGLRVRGPGGFPLREATGDDLARHRWECDI